MLALPSTKTFLHKQKSSSFVPYWRMYRKTTAHNVSLMAKTNTRLIHMDSNNDANKKCHWQFNSCWRSDFVVEKNPTDLVNIFYILFICQMGVQPQYTGQVEVPQLSWWKLKVAKCFRMCNKATWHTLLKHWALLQDKIFFVKVLNVPAGFEGLFSNKLIWAKLRFFVQETWPKNINDLEFHLDLKK